MNVFQHVIFQFVQITNLSLASSSSTHHPLFFCIRFSSALGHLVPQEKQSDVEHDLNKAASQISVLTEQHRLLLRRDSERKKEHFNVGEHTLWCVSGSASVLKGSSEAHKCTTKIRIGCPLPSSGAIVNTCYLSRVEITLKTSPFTPAARPAALWQPLQVIKDPDHWTHKGCSHCKSTPACRMKTIPAQLRRHFKM